MRGKKHFRRSREMRKSTEGDKTSCGKDADKENVESIMEAVEAKESCSALIECSILIYQHSNISIAILNQRDDSLALRNHVSPTTNLLMVFA